MICYQQTILNLSSQFVMIVFHWYLILFLSDPDRSRCNNRRSNSNSRRACTCRTLHWPIAYHITSYWQEKVHWLVGWLVGRHVHTLLAAAFHLTVPHPLSCFSGVTSSRSLNLDIFAACIILILNTAAILEESSDFIIGYHSPKATSAMKRLCLTTNTLIMASKMIGVLWPSFVPLGGVLQCFCAPWSARQFHHPGLVGIEWSRF